MTVNGRRCPCRAAEYGCAFGPVDQLKSRHSQERAATPGILQVPQITPVSYGSVVPSLLRLSWHKHGGALRAFALGPLPADALIEHVLGFRRSIASQTGSGCGALSQPGGGRAGATASGCGDSPMWVRARRKETKVRWTFIPSRGRVRDGPPWASKPSSIAQCLRRCAGHAGDCRKGRRRGRDQYGAAPSGRRGSRGCAEGPRGLKLDCQVPLNGRGGTGRFPVMAERSPIPIARRTRDRAPSGYCANPTCWRVRVIQYRR
jgi:hypothetical protein